MAKEYEFLIQDSETQKVYDVSEVVSGKIGWDTQMQSGASKLTFSYQDGHMFPNGSVVRFKYNKADIFYGYIFTVSDDNGTMSVTAYDSLRYFKYKDTKIIKGLTASGLVKEITTDRNLRVGNIDSTDYILPDRIEDNKTYLDMIYDALSDTLLATNWKYVLYDRFGSICLTEAEKLKLPIALGDESLATGYNYEKSIDGETYNRIKLAQDNKETGTRESYIVQDGESMAKWGILQYYEKVNDNLNSAQIEEKAEKLLKYYNQEEKKFSLPCLGDVRVIGGSGIYIELAQGKNKIKQWAMVNKANHSFDGQVHTMDLELLL